jgi:hypothetical protein
MCRSSATPGHAPGHWQDYRRSTPAAQGPNVFLKLPVDSNKSYRLLSQMKHQLVTPGARPFMQGYWPKAGNSNSQGHTQRHPRKQSSVPISTTPKRSNHHKVTFCPVTTVVHPVPHDSPLNYLSSNCQMLRNLMSTGQDDYYPLKGADFVALGPESRKSARK